MVRALNAAGEQFALKRLAPIDSNGLVGADSRRRRFPGSDKALVPSAKSGSADEGAPGGSADAVSLFNHEYEMHRRLSGLRGFPRLYGRGKVEGRPVIVMEWVEGEPLSSAMGKMVIDDDGRLSSLAAARLGRDLFDILARMDVLEEAVVHRDVSPRNIVVETAQVSLAEQVEEGVFKLRLIEFGSAEETKGGGGASLRSWGQRKGATADYAAPELLDNRLGEANERRRAAAVDVYAATSILYQLLEGHPPFDLSLAVREDDGARTAFRIKTELQFPPICGVHGSERPKSPLCSSESRRWQLQWAVLRPSWKWPLRLQRFGWPCVRRTSFWCPSLPQDCRWTPEGAPRQRRCVMRWPHSPTITPRTFPALCGASRCFPALWKEMRRKRNGIWGAR